MKYSLKQYLTNAENVFNLFTYEIKIITSDTESETFLFTQNFEMICDENVNKGEKNNNEFDKLHFDIE